MALCKWHGPTFEPAVEYLGDSLKGSLALLGGDGDLVHGLSMQVGDFSLPAGQVLELLDGTHADDLLHVVGDPDGDGVAPEPVAGEAPVLGIGQPVMETALLDVSGNPLGLLIVGH